MKRKRQAGRAEQGTFRTWVQEQAGSHGAAMQAGSWPCMAPCTQRASKIPSTEYPGTAQSMSTAGACAAPSLYCSCDSRLIKVTFRMGIGGEDCTNALLLMLSAGEPTVPLEKPQLSREGKFLL